MGSSCPTVLQCNGGRVMAPNLDAWVALHSIYIWTVRPYSFLAGLGRNQVYAVILVQSMLMVNQFEPVWLSRKHAQRAYCCNIYTVLARQTEAAFLHQ